MLIRIILLALLYSLPSFASSVVDKDIQELFKKYDLIMNEKKVEHLDEVFTKNFFKGSGGKSEFITKVKSLPHTKSRKQSNVTWKKGVRNEVYLIKLKKDSDSEFIVIKEDGKLKIDGTIGDSN